MMKIAKKVVAAFYMECPQCREKGFSGCLANPESGSLLWDANTNYGVTTAKCAECGEESKVPKF